MGTLEKTVLVLHTILRQIFEQENFCSLTVLNILWKRNFANQGSLIAKQRSLKHFASLTFAVKDAAVKTAKFMPLEIGAIRYICFSCSPTSMVTRISTYLPSLYLRERFT